MAIQDYKVSEAYSGRDIASLSDRPNQDGLTAAQLKARFDQLGKEVIPKYNDLIDLLDTYIQSNDTNIGALEDAIDGLGIALGDLGLSVQEVLDAYNSGALQGKSAYELAVEQGFVGTEEEWLASLQGAQGQGFVILGRYDTLLELETAHPVGQVGDAWSVGTVDPYDVYVWNSDLNDWDNIGQISPSNDASGITYNGIIDGYLVNNVEEALDTIDTSLAGKANSTHTHVTSDVTGLDTALSGKAPISHTHTIANIISLQGTLDSKQPNLISGTNIKTINSTSLLGSGDLVIESGDWKTINATLTYASADSPTFVANTSVDLTSIISVGMKIKLTQTTVKYFIVTAITSTTITLYGGTDYTLSNATITLPFVSSMKAPFGFPLNTDKWSVIFTDTTSRSQSSPAQNTWYNLGGLTFSLPIGLWEIKYSCFLYAERTGASPINVFSTISNGNNTQSYSQFTIKVSDNAKTDIGQSVINIQLLEVSSKTTMYLNARTTLTSINSIYFVNADVPFVVKAVCAYL